MTSLTSVTSSVDVTAATSGVLLSSKEESEQQEVVPFESAK